MIVTVTLNPAVDKTCRLESVNVGEVNRLRECISVAGGKGINVAKLIRQFHMNVCTLGFLGGRSGLFIEEAMEETGAALSFTKIGGVTRTNTNLIADDGKVTELLEPGPVITEEEYLDFMKRLEYALEDCSLLVLSGSVASGLAPDIYAKIISLCRREHIKTVLDTSGGALKLGIAAIPYMVKPNRAELEYLAGRELPTLDDVKEEARKLLAKGITKVVVSLGSEGLLYMDEHSEIFEPAKQVKALNTVGCGDSVVASLCMSEINGDDPALALSKASALAAANALSLKSGEIDMNDYLKLL